MLSTHQKRQILGRASSAAAPQGLAGLAGRAALGAWGLAALVALSACGQKGPLYLPGNAPNAASPASNSVNTADDNLNLNNNPAVTR